MKRNIIHRLRIVLCMALIVDNGMGVTVRPSRSLRVIHELAYSFCISNKSDCIQHEYSVKN